MDITKKIISVVGVFALILSITGGMVAAQDPVTTSDGIGISFTVSCVASSTTAVTVTNNSGIGPVAFPNFDPASDVQTVSTADNAIRVNVTLGCPTDDWSLSSTITDFTTPADPGPVHTLAGSYFQLVSTNQWTTDGTNAVPNVSEPASPVIYSGVGPAYSSPALAAATGTTLTNSSMYMDFTGQLHNLPDDLEDGNYSATLTVTYNAGTP
jgi:hypothetical protein